MINLAAMILLLSMVLQIAASVLALKLIKLTGKSASWLLIAGALLLMSLRRIIALTDVLALNARVNQFNEVVGLALSLMMFLGISGIKSIFLERKRSEEKVQALLAEKETILREVHHRLKNNMSNLISLLNLQASRLSEPSAIKALEEAGLRVRSMLLLYEQLNQSCTFLEAPVRDFLSALIDTIYETFPARASIRLEKDLDDFILDTKRLQILGIIVNELMTNSMKHAFKDTAVGVLSVSLSLAGSRIVLRVRDDGSGIPASMDSGPAKGVGLQVVRALASQLDGTIHQECKHGTVFVLDFPRETQAGA